MNWCACYPVCFWIADGRTGHDHGGQRAGFTAGTARLGGLRRAVGLRFQRATAGRKSCSIRRTLLALLDVSGKPLWHGPGRSRLSGQIRRRQRRPDHGLQARPGRFRRRRQVRDRFGRLRRRRAADRPTNRQGPLVAGGPHADWPARYGRQYRRPQRRRDHLPGRQCAGGYHGRPHARVACCGPGKARRP